jgi:hypothetical protein
MALRKAKDSRAADIVAARARNAAPVAETYGERIEKGEPGSEDVLIEALSFTGHVAMARDFVQSGNPLLEEAGRLWLEDHGKPVSKAAGKEHGPRWGGSLSVP